MIPIAEIPGDASAEFGGWTRRQIVVHSRLADLDLQELLREQGMHFRSLERRLLLSIGGGILFFGTEGRRHGGGNRMEWLKIEWNGRRKTDTLG